MCVTRLLMAGFGQCVVLHKTTLPDLQEPLHHIAFICQTFVEQQYIFLH